MRYKITNPKRMMIVGIIVIMLVMIACLVYFNCFKSKEKTVAKLDNMEERKIEEPNGEYIDIEELEEQQQEEEEQNIIEEDIPKNEITNNVQDTTTNTTPYYIKINYGAQVVTIYKKDAEGNYTIPIKAMVCSTGVATPTSGVYSIPARWEWLGLQGDVYGHYCTQIKGNILFHSVPYLRRGDAASLEYWEYDKLGTYASAGCIRLMVKDAKWIYDNCARGTKVEFYSSSNPGPLGKPSAKKISSYPDYLRNWDPTDQNTSNPWHTYKEETTQTKPKNEIENNTVNEITNTTKNEVTNIISNEIETNQSNRIENEIANEIANEIENKITNETANEIINEIENKIINEQQNEIKKDTNTEKPKDKVNSQMDEVA